MPNVLNLDGIALTSTQGKLKRKVELLAREKLAPRAAEVDRLGAFPRHGVEAMAEAGLLGLSLGEDVGGLGQPILTAVMVVEQLAIGCSSTAMVYVMHLSTLPLLDVCCSGEQRQHLLRRITQGQLAGFAMSEPGSGTRIWHMDSYAVRDGDDYILNTFKSFCTSAGQADFYLVPLRSSPDVDTSDISIFWVDGRDPGVQPQGTWDGMGMRGNSSTPIAFKDCRVPPIQRIGEENEGFSSMMAYTLPIYLLGLSSVYLGIAQAAFEHALAHVKERVHTDTGQSLAHVETVQRYFAEMRLQIDHVRCMILRVAQMADNATVLFNEFHEAGLLDDIIRENPDDPFFVELAQVKVAACEMAVDVTNKALQVCGGRAYKRGHLVERAYRDARAGSLQAPADDVLKVIIGHQLLGLPQPWA